MAAPATPISCGAIWGSDMRVLPKIAARRRLTKRQVPVRSKQASHKAFRGKESVALLPSMPLNTA